jgi:hypothetical protein
MTDKMLHLWSLLISIDLSYMYMKLHNGEG